MSSAYAQEKVLSVHHWNDTLFSFTTTRDPGLRFKTGQFVMIGLEVNGKPLMRAYSIVSAHYEEHLEFYSIKVPDGPLTSRLQHLTDSAFLPHFLQVYPQPAPWQLLHLPPKSASQLISVLFLTSLPLP